MIFSRVLFLFVLSLFVFASSSEANMKKGQLGDDQERSFFFSTNSDGPCSAALIYDAVTSDLDVFITLAENGDVIAAGLSQQNNYDAAEAGLPPGEYVLVVDCFEGASTFRAVVNCSNQETLSNFSAGAAQGVELKEVELSPRAKKALERFQAATSHLKRPRN